MHVVPRSSRVPSGRRAEWLGIAAGAGALLAAGSIYAQRRAREAPREHPPLGRFVAVDGVRLHVWERGRGQPLLLLHGAGAMIHDMLLSGIVAELATRHRVIVVDRPGQGFSDRPDDRTWTPEAQADLIAGALRVLGATDDVLVFGHSWGSLVALALRHAPRVGGLVLAGGYYFATPRLDVPVLSSAAWPGIGTIGRHTVLPLVGRAIWPLLLRRLFGPAPVPPVFARRFPTWLALRPEQLRAVAEDIAMLPAAAERLASHARDVAVPAAIVVGRDDRLIDPERQSIRFRREHMPHAALHVIAGAGHMVHHSAAGRVIRAIDEVAKVGRAGDNEATVRRLAPARIQA